MKKCFYCNRMIDTPNTISIKNEKIDCCDDLYSTKARAFINFAERTKFFFAISVTASILMAFGPLFPICSNAIRTILLCIGWGLLGLTICVFPLATPETFQLLGVKKTIRLVRVVGCLLILITPIWPMIML